MVAESSSLRFTSEESCDLDILNLDYLEWTVVSISETSKTFFLKKTIDALLDSNAVNSYPLEKSRTLPGRNFGYLNSNLKGLLSVSNGNNVMVLNVDD